jgi:hypothetical protein
MMPSTIPLATALWVTCLVSTGLAFDCPSLETVDGPSIASQIAKLLPPGDDLVAPDQLGTAVFELHSRGIDPAEAVNSLFAAFCPRIAANTQLTDAQKDQRAREFSQMATTVVFSGSQ